MNPFQSLQALLVGTRHLLATSPLDVLANNQLQANRAMLLSEILFE